jgi:hypothetical protein
MTGHLDDFRLLVIVRLPLEGRTRSGSICNQTRAIFRGGSGLGLGFLLHKSKSPRVGFGPKPNFFI